MSTWTQHSIYDAECDWQTVRTNGKRWQQKVREDIDTMIDADKLIARLTRLKKKFDSVFIESEYTMCGDSCSKPVIEYWKEISPRARMLKFIGESERDRWRRRDVHLHAQRMKDPVYAKIHMEAAAEIHKEMQEQSAKAFRRFDRIFKSLKHPTKAAKKR